jgi:hypothetical protein
MRAVSLARQVGEPLAIDEHLGLSIREALQQIAGPRRAMFLPQSDRFVATTADNRQSEWVTSDMTLDQLRRMLGNQDIVLHLNVEARGGGGEVAEAVEVGSCLVMTEESRDKLRAYSKAVTRKHGNVECSFFLLGPEGEPSLVSDVILLCDQRVWHSGFEASARAVEATAREALEEHPDLVVKGIAHRHPGSGQGSVFHSAVDEEFIEERLMPVIAQHLFVERGWSRELSPEKGSNGSIVVPLDPQSGRSVKLDLTGSPRRGGEEITASLEGTDLVAEVFSLVFSKDDHQFCRSIRFSSCPAVLSEDGARLVKLVDPEDIGILVVPAVEAGVAPAEYPDDIALDTEVRRKVSIGWTSTYSSSSKTGTSADSLDDTFESSLANLGLGSQWPESSAAGLSIGAGDSLSELLETLSVLIRRIARKVAEHEDKPKHVADRRI